MRSFLNVVSVSFVHQLPPQRRTRQPNQLELDLSPTRAPAPAPAPREPSLRPFASGSNVLVEYIPAYILRETKDAGKFAEPVSCPVRVKEPELTSSRNRLLAPLSFLIRLLLLHLCRHLKSSLRRRPSFLPSLLVLRSGHAPGCSRGQPCELGKLPSSLSSSRSRQHSLNPQQQSPRLRPHLKSALSTSSHRLQVLMRLPASRTPPPKHRLSLSRDSESMPHHRRRS